MRPAARSSRAKARPARRVSGPARPAARRSTAPRPTAPASRPVAALGGRLAAAVAVALPQHAPRPSAPPRRRPAAVPRPARRPDLPAGARLLARLRALPDHRLLDRLIGGRAWIVLIGGLLVGIVTMQLALLRLNAGISHAVERGAALEQRNAELRLAISRLSDSARIVELGTQMGLVTPPQGSPRFLTAGVGDARKALATMRVPQPAAVVPVTTAAVTDTTVDPAVATTVDATATDPAAVDPAAASVPTTDAAGTTASTPVTDTTAATGATTGATTAAPVVPAATSAPVTAGGAAAAVVPQG